MTLPLLLLPLLLWRLLLVTVLRWSAVLPDAPVLLCFLQLAVLLVLLFPSIAQGEAAPQHQHTRNQQDGRHIAACEQQTHPTVVNHSLVPARYAHGRVLYCHERERSKPDALVVLHRLLLGVWLPAAVETIRSPFLVLTRLGKCVHATHFMPLCTPTNQTNTTA